MAQLAQHTGKGECVMGIEVRLWGGYGFVEGRPGQFRVVVAGNEQEAACALGITVKQLRQDFRQVTDRKELEVVETMPEGEVWIAPRGSRSFEEADPEELEV